jgi:undecaprenyl diphosphate synthase
MEMEYIERFSRELGLYLDPEKVPEHIAIVMDGNGRWAKQRGLERSAGHRKGVEALENIVIGCRNLGVRYLTVYAFSTENWSRPVSEVGTLMSLLSEFAASKLARLRDNQVRVQVLGDFDGLPILQRTALNRLMAATAAQDGLVLNLALNYGGRAEILRAVKKAAAELSPKQLQDMTEADFGGYLTTAGQPDPDLLIRTSGELRLSNFLLWQLAYAEFYFTDVLWPDFGEEELFRAVCAYQHRSRRFGGVEAK